MMGWYCCSRPTIWVLATLMLQDMADSQVRQRGTDYLKTLVLAEEKQHLRATLGSHLFAENYA